MESGIALALKKNRREQSERLVEWLFLAPALLVFLVFFVYPTSTSLWFSFTNWNGIGKNYRFVGFDNYLKLFTNQDIFETLPTTGYYALLNTAMLSVFGFLVALALNRQAWVTNLLRVAFFTPMLIAGVIVGFVFQEMYAPVLNEENMGIINRLLSMVGLDFLRASWLGNPNTAMLVVVLTGVWNQVGQTALIYLAAMQIIPGELYESAEMDGADYWTKTWHITWKMVAPAFTLNMVLLLINSLKQYDMIALLTQGGPGLATRVINIAILDYSISSFKVGLGCAMAMVVTLFVFLTVLLINFILRKRENRGNE